MKVDKELIRNFVKYNNEFRRGYLIDDKLTVIQSEISELDNKLCGLRKRKQARIKEILNLCGIEKGLRFSDRHGETFEIQEIRHSRADIDNSEEIYVFAFRVNKKGKTLKTQDAVFNLPVALKIIEQSSSVYYAD